MNRCPMHDTPDDLYLEAAWSWCPEDCEQLAAELDRRVEDVTVNGNFTRMTVVDGVMYRQQFRNHEPIEEPVEWRTA